MSKVIIKASDIVKLLDKKHSLDVSLAECKNGATQVAYRGEMLKLDYWAMKNAWASPVYSGYEIKVSRSDFVNDDKWHRYLPYCSDFYFVSPTGLIQPSELPPEAGLLWVAKTGTRLFVKKKAPRRAVEPPADLFKYVLMCRLADASAGVEITHDEEYWREWLTRKKENQNIGHRVSRRLSELHSKLVTEVDCENKWLKAENENLADIKKVLESLGITAGRYTSERVIRNAVEQERASLMVKDLESLLLRVKAVSESEA